MFKYDYESPRVSFEQKFFLTQHLLAYFSPNFENKNENFTFDVTEIQKLH